MYQYTRHRKGEEMYTSPTFEDDSFNSQASFPDVQSSITNLLYHNILSTKVERPTRMQNIEVHIYNQTNDLEYKGTMMNDVHIGINILVDRNCDGNIFVSV